MTTRRTLLASLAAVPLAGGFRCEAFGGGDPGQYKSVKLINRKSGLGREAEQFADEVSLADHISIGQPSNSALPDHVHCLDALQRPPCTLKGSIALGRPTSFLHRPVAQFNHVIEIFALAQSDAARDGAMGFQRFHRSRIGRVLVYVHHPWHRPTFREQCPV